MKTNFPKLSSFITVIFIFSSFPLFHLAKAQTSSTTQNIEFISGYVYQGGRKKGLKQTTSSVCLPDLNAILSPTPLPKSKPVVQKPEAKAKPTQHSRTTSGPTASRTQNNPRFGYGSSVPTGPMGEISPVDPLVPIDPGYDPEPVQKKPIPKARPIPQKQPAQVSVEQSPISQPIIQLHRSTNAYPFSHSYFPRTYHYCTPYAPFPVVPFYGGGYGYHPLSPKCGTYPSRVPLRGSCTSSLNYLSGFGRRGFSAYFSF